MSTARKPLPETALAAAFGRRFTDMCKAKFPRETQAQLARRFQVSQPMISDYQRGVKLPSTAQMMNMARVFGCSMEYLASGAEVDNPDILDVSDLNEAQRKILRDMKAALLQAPTPGH